MTKDVWTSLCTKAQWDIMVAMRGPDLVSSDVIKWFSTSVLRGQMKDVYRVGGLVNANLPFIILPKGRVVREGCEAFDSYHFCEHVITAANWMGVPIVGINGSFYREGVGKGIKNCAEFWGEKVVEGQAPPIKEAWTAHRDYLQSKWW